MTRVRREIAAPSESIAQRFAFASIAAGVVLRAWTLWRVCEPADAWAGDALIYRDTIEGFLRGRIDPDLWVWTPGYPLLATPIAAVAGSATALHIVSFVAGAAIPLLAFLVARALGDPATGALAALCLAFSPEIAMASARPLSDAAALALLLLSFWILVREPIRTALRKGRTMGRGRATSTLAAGLVAGLASLSRPETLLAVPFFPFLTRGARPGRVHVLFLGATGMVLLPYVVGLHQVSGVWGMSLKPAMNLLKLHVYETSGPYYEARAAWGATLKSVSDEKGELIPRELARAAEPYMDLGPRAVATRWAGHMRVALQQTRPDKIALALFGLAGLALPGSIRPRLAFTVFSFPFLGVPLFVNPLGRFLLPALPGHAWGLSRLARFAARHAGKRSARVSAFALGLVALFVAGRGVALATLESGSVTRLSRLVEIEAAINENDLPTAERLLGHFLKRQPRDSTGLQLRGRLEDLKGNPTGAERAFLDAIAEGAQPLAFAEFLLKRDRVADADSVLRSLSASPPSDADYWKLSGHTAFRLGRLDDALRAFERAETLEGVSPESHFNLAIVLERLGRVDEAKAILRQVAGSRNEAIAARSRQSLERLEAGADSAQDTSNLTP